jgi:hypothetical protein
VTIDVNTAQMRAAARGLAGDTNSASAGYDALHTAMASISGMAGSDPAAREWGAQFDSGLASALGAHHDVIAALASCAELTDATATNHANADGQSVLGPKPAPEQLGISKTNLTPGPQTAPPSSAGSSGDGQPAWWRWIKDRVGDIWPNGHQDRLHTAGSALRKAAGTLNDAAGAMQPRIDTVKAQTSPEIAPAVNTLGTVQGGLRDIAGVYEQLAKACDDLAQRIDEAHSKMEQAAAEIIGLTLVSFVPGLEELLAGVAARIAEIYEEFRAVLAVARVALTGAEDTALVQAQAMRPIAEAVSEARSFASADRSLIEANQAAGNAARDSVKNEYFPNARTEVTQDTPLGLRRIDILDGNHAVEVKNGRTALTTTGSAPTQLQIAKDVELMKQGFTVEWVFTKSEVTGATGPTGPLADALAKAGIPWRNA